MQATLKRVLAVVLTLSILLSLGLSAVLVSAAEYGDASVVYNFDYYEAIAPESAAGAQFEIPAVQTQNKELYESENSAVNWMYTAINANYPGQTTFTQFVTAEKAEHGYGFLRVRAIEGDWIAFKIKNPGAGVEQSITVTHPGSKNGAGVASLYVLPANTEDIGAAIKSTPAIGSVSFYDKSVGSAETPKVDVKETILQGTWTPGNDAEYILVLEASKMHESASSAYLYQSEIIMTDASTLPLNIQAEVAAENAVRSATCQVAITTVVNGHDYMCMFTKGSQLWVYDLDTKELVDIEYNAFGTPRAAVVDSNGIIWACGAAFYLYRYDPATGEGKQIPFSSGLFPVDKSFNALGITVDENDVLYFGTYNRGHIGMYDPKTNTFENLSGWLNSSETLEPDAQYAGFGGLLYKDGYLYFGVDGDKNGDKITTHEIVKFSIAERKIVASRDVTECWGAGGTYLGFMNLVGNYILGGSGSWQSKTCAIDITTDTLEIVTLPGDMDVGFSGFVSGEIDGKRYCLGNTKKEDGMFEIDLETMVVTELDQAAFPPASIKLNCWNGSLVTIEGDDRLPGTSLVTYNNNTQNGTVELIFYNIETMETVVWEAFTLGLGNGNQLQALTVDPSGRYIYTGAYGCNTVAQYDIEAGKVTKSMPSYDHQTDSLMWHNGKLYAGNYQACTITEIDVETGTAKPLFAIKNTAFSQYRMHALAAGDGKVFGGSVPSSDARKGGVLVWYDYEKGLTYVAAGPNPEDVFYCDTSVNPANNVWYSAVTNEKMDFDDNDDGTDDADITLADGSKMQRFTGLIKNQTINALVYKNGYIFGSTSQYGGSGATTEGVDNACLFVYDVEAMKVIATCDLSTVIEGLKTPVEFVETIAADPIIDGMFWGVVSDTLFAFAFDYENNAFVVEEAISFGKEAYDVYGDAWCGRNMVFDGNYMYVSFANAGLYMINRFDLSEYKILAENEPKHMVMGADGDLYITDQSTNLKKLDTSDYTQTAVKDGFQAILNEIPETLTLEDLNTLLNVSKAYEALADATAAAIDVTKLDAAEKQAAAMVQTVFDAIPADVKLSDEADINAVRYLYNDLSGRVQKLLNISNLTAAEKKIAELKEQAIAAEVDALIAAIGTVTLDSEEAIKAARVAYEELTENQKSYVTKLSVLTAAEARLEELKNPKTGDTVPVMALAGILAVSAVAVVAMAADSKKKRA